MNYSFKRIYCITVIALLFCFKTEGSDHPETGLIRNPPQEVRRFNVFEINIGAVNQNNNPYTDGPELSAVFNGPNGVSYKTNGYWDGENIFSIRFSPPLEGDWTYTTTSTDPGLNGISGSFKAIQSTEKELRSNRLLHGFLETEGYGFKLSDGKTYIPVGETQWSFTEEFHTEEWKEWIKTLKDRGYNSFLGCIWLGIYNRANISPFRDFREERLNVEFFQRLDEWIAFANQHGILMGLTVGGFPENSKWFSLFDTKEKNDRWFQYCVRRYAAFNVRWVLYGEVDEVNPSWATWEENAEAMAQLIKREDPYNHPVGSHHRRIDRATASSPDIDYLCVQFIRNGRASDNYQYRTLQDYRQYKKPLWFEEYWYENEEGLNPGIHNTYRNFIAGLAFPTMGSLMRAHEKDSEFVPELAKKENRSISEYLMENDSGMQCMQYFSEFVTDLNILDYSPASHKIRNPDVTRQCGRFGNSYLIYQQNRGQIHLDLTNATGKFKVEKLDIFTGKRVKLPCVTAGSWCTIDSNDSRAAVIRVSGGEILE
jgi:hypothetical protein